MSNKPPIDRRVEEIEAEVVAEAKLPATRSLDTAENVASKTTVEQDLKSAGQRDLNLVWENTQRNLAYGVIGCSLAIDTIVVLVGLFMLARNIRPSVEVLALGTASLMQINTMAGLILGFYFGRTNHARFGDDTSTR